MKGTKLFIRGMCCERCIDKVKQLLDEGNLKALSTTLGAIHFERKPTDKQIEMLNRKLEPWGFSIASSHAEQVVAKAKVAIFQYMNDMAGKNTRLRLSDYIEKKVGLSYSYISRIFSDLEQLTLEKFLILLKTERVKELLLQDNATLSDIAYTLGYSSSQSLSGQFKKITGKTPGQFRRYPVPERKPLDKMGVQDFIQNHRN